MADFCFFFWRESSNVKHKLTFFFIEPASMNMRMQEGIALHLMGIVQAIESDISGSRNSFLKSIELFNKLGALFELEKKYPEYARMYENGFIMEAEITGKSTAFDSKRNNFREMLRHFNEECEPV